MILEKFTPLTQRFIISGITLFILFAVIYNSYLPLLAPAVPLLSMIVIGLAVKEYYQIARKKGLHPREKTGIALTILYILAIFLSARTPYLDLLPLMSLAITLVTVFSAYFVRGQDPFINVAVTLFGILYLAIPLSCVIQINYFFLPDSVQDGRWWLFYLLAITYLTDSCGLFFGKAFGRTKFAPFISPSKTWEGAIGAFFSAVLISMGFAYFANHSGYSIPMRLSFPESLALGAFLSVLAQLGDLSESLLKRDVGVKDSSKIPGLGGMLDVVDSLVFTAPVLYLYLRYQNPVL